MGHFGFSYMGIIFLLLLIVPNLVWTKHQPKGYDPMGIASTPASSLYSKALPSTMGSPPAGPMLPKPSTALPSVTTATSLPLVV